MLTDNYEGTLYARPNDLTVDKKGGVYFSDAGLNPDQNPPPPPMPLAVYYINPAGKDDSSGRQHHAAQRGAAQSR